MKKIIFLIVTMLFATQVIASTQNIKEKGNKDRLVSFSDRPDVKIASLGDPFKSYLTKLRVRKQALLKNLRQKSKGRTRTPLEIISLSSLRFSGVYRDKDHQIIAMLEDSEGKGYLARAGDYIGKNNGFITSIGKESITIVEKSIDKFGGLKDKVIDVRLDRASDRRSKKLKNKIL